jgi:hypothetical protein
MIWTEDQAVADFAQNMGLVVDTVRPVRAESTQEAQIPSVNSALHAISAHLWIFELFSRYPSAHAVCTLTCGLSAPSSIRIGLLLWMQDELGHARTHSNECQVLMHLAEFLQTLSLLRTVRGDPASGCMPTNAIPYTERTSETRTTSKP